jgi:NADH-quinone oxidoreductase subunit N
MATIGAFAILTVVRKGDGEASHVSDWAGLAKRSPVLAHCMFCFMFSLVGLPPFAGFVAKVNVLLVLINNGGWWWVLVAVIGLNTIASLYYYVRVIKAMYVEPSAEPSFAGHPVAVALALVCAASLVLMFVRTGKLNDVTRNYSRIHNVTGGATTRPVAPLTTRPTAVAVQTP